eukprot:13092808-Alexandrium_andersonii.AAC.1
MSTESLQPDERLSTTDQYLAVLNTFVARHSNSHGSSSKQRPELFGFGGYNVKRRDQAVDCSALA